MKTYAVILIYILSITLANLSAANFGVWVTPINAFFLIGLEITIRDVLHEKVNHLQILIIVLIAGTISYLINIDTKEIALASFLAVVVSCILDYVVFKKTKGTWLKKSNTSNIFSSASDSLIFPTVAFGGFNPLVTIFQFILKLLGGLFWSLIISKFKTK